MKTSGIDNSERWARAVHHCVPSQHQLANPAHYHSFHVLRFWQFPKFWKYYFMWIFAVFHNYYVQSLLAVCLMYYVHVWSFQLYVQPIEFIGAPLSCAKIPVQWHCALLKTLQDYTFSGINDLFKLALTLVTQLFIRVLARATFPSSTT